MNIKTLLLFAMLTTVFFANTSDIFAQCDAAFIEALKTRYQEKSSSTIDEGLYDASCTSTSSVKKFGLNISRPQYGELGAKNNSSSTSQACAERNYTYFSDNKTEIATSFLPKEGLEIISRCIGGGRPFLSASKIGNIVTIKASSFADNSTTGEVAKVNKEDGFKVLGNDGRQLVCKGTFSPNERLIPGGKIITCTSSENENIYISLNTNRGGVDITIPRTPAIKWEPFLWELNFFGPLVGDPRRPRDYQCLSKGTTFGSILPVPVPWSAPRNDVMRGVCLATHGAGVLTVDDEKPKVLGDTWGYITDNDQTPERDGRYITCTLNGNPIGETRINSVRKQVSRSDEAKIGYCANRYGIN